MLAGFGDAIGGRAEAGRGRRPGPQHSGRDRRAVAQRLAGVLGRGAARHRAGQRRVAGHRDRATSSSWSRALGKVSTALDSRESALQDLITNFNLTTAALADEQVNLRRTLHVLPEVLEAANPALDELNAALPPTRAFALEIMPGVRETPATIDAAFPWIEQTRSSGLPGRAAGPGARPSARGGRSGRVHRRHRRRSSRRWTVQPCVKDNLMPTGDVVLNDPPLSSGSKNYKEFFQALVGFAGESENFDGNGAYTRFQTGSGDQTVATDAVPGAGPLFANAVRQPLGSRPVKPGKKPPFNRSEPCFTQKRPDLNSARTGDGP